MSDEACVRFLRWALPRLRMRWQGFRKVRRQVCRRVERRRRELGLADLEGYRSYLDAHPEEWTVLDGLCRVTISRFYRDRGVFDRLERRVLPALAEAALARGAEALEAWSVGCASGEEPYTLAVLWRLALAQRFTGVGLRVLATDVDETLLARAREACFGRTSLRDLPEAWHGRAFERRGDLFCLRPEYRRPVTLRRHDVRDGAPVGPFDLVLCRNLAFTYFDEELQGQTATRLVAALGPGGALVVGAHEELPEDVAGLVPWEDASCVFRRAP